MQYTVAIDGVNVSVSQLNIITTVDKTLDYGSFLVRNKREEAYDVGTMVDIDITDGVDTFNYHFIIQADDVQKIKGGVYIHSIDIIELTKILEWETESVRTFTQVVGGLTLSLLDVVTRLQISIPMVRNANVDSTRIFAIETSLANILRNVEAPEFVFANKNLKEILMEVFDFIGALPRLIKVSNDIILTADFYNKRRNKINENEFSRMERFNINEFGTALDVDLKNLFDSYTQVVEPGPNNYKRLYAVDGDFAQDNLVLKTDYPIIDIVSLKVKTDLLPAGVSNVNNPGKVLTNVVIDITPCILERDLWENLSNAGFTNSFEQGQYRDNTLFFNRFRPDITNLYDVVGAFSNAPIVVGTERIEAVLQRALQLSDLTYDDNGTPKKLLLGRNPRISNYAEIEFQIVYKAQVDSRTEIKRLDTRRIKFNSQSYTGQIDNVVRADRVLDKLFKTQQLLGNAEIMTSERTKTLSSLFSLGDYTDDDYILTTAEFQFDKNYVTAKYMWTQNFNKVSEFIGLNSAIRLFPIPKDTYQRNVYLEDIIEIGTTLKANTSDITSSGIQTFMNTFNNSPSGTFNRPITNIAFDNPVVPSYDTTTNIIVKPITAYAGGNSINFHFEFDNASVAGWQIDIDSETGSQTLSFDDINREDPTAPGFWDVVGSIVSAGWNLFLKTDTVGTTTAVSYKSAQDAALEGNTLTTLFKKPIVNGIYYVDDNGFVGVFSFDLIDGFTVSNAGNLPIVAKTNLGTKLVSGVNYLVAKDAREELAMTYAVHVVPEPTFEKTFIVGKYLVERNNLLKSISTASNQFEVFTATIPYDVIENQFSRSTDVVSTVTYSITGTQGNAVTLSADITAPVWGIRKKTTKELVIVVNQGSVVIRTIYFNMRDRKTGVVYPSQNIVILPPVLRPASFQVVAPFPTSSVINLAWTDTNSPSATQFEFGFSIDLVNWTSEIVTTNTKSVTGLDSETVYTFRVRAKINNDFSEYVYVTQATLAATPPKPVGLTLTLLSERRILIQWSAIEDVLLYRIEISKASNFTPLIVGGLQQAFTNFYVLDFINTPSLEFDTTYFIRVRALKGGQFSDFADTVSIKTGLGPLTSAPLLTNVSVSGSNVTFTLVNTDDQLVTLFADFVNGTTSRATGVRPNEAKTFTLAFTSQTTIFAKAKAVLKDDSAIVQNEFAPGEPPNTATILTGSDGLSAIPRFNILTFRYSTALVKVDGFFVERNPDLQGNNSFGLVTDLIPPVGRNFVGTGQDEYRFIDRQIVSGQSYTYRVRAVNRLGISTSTERSITSAVSVPAQPTGEAIGNVLAGGPGEAFFILTWTRNSTDESGFRIQRRVGAAAFADVGGTAKAQTSLDQTIIGAPNTTYDYRIIAFNENGDSTPSGTVSILVV
jgi:hypothetical protein